MSEDGYWPYDYDPEHRDLLKAWWAKRLDAHPSAWPLDMTPVTCAWCLYVLLLRDIDVHSICCYYREGHPAEPVSQLLEMMQDHAITTRAEAVTRALHRIDGVCHVSSRGGRGRCALPAGHLGEHDFRFRGGG